MNFGIGADVLEELLQRAVEADLLLHRLHLGLETRDFVEADLVDCVRRQVGRRVDLDQIAIELPAALHVLQADARRALRADIRWR